MAQIKKYKLSNEGNPDDFYKIRKIADVPKEYRQHPNFEELIKDPAHNDKIVPGALREAMAIIEAEKTGLIKAVATRPDNPYIDFYDGDGRPFDVKTPPSPPTNAKYPFDYVSAGNSVVSQLQKNEANLKTGKEEPVRVLLDTSYLTREDRGNMWSFIKENATGSEISRIVEVKTKTSHNKSKNKFSVMNRIVAKGFFRN